MNELKVFENPEFGKIRAIEKDGGPWFVATDLCRALEPGEVHAAMRCLDDGEKGRCLIPTPGGKQEMSTIVNESGLYTLVLGRRKPEAKAFKRWITHEVLPAIHKTGSYSRHETYLPKETSAGDIAQLLKILRATMKENNQSPEVISRTVKMVCEQFEVMLPENFVKQISFQQYIFEGML